MEACIDSAYLYHSPCNTVNVRAKVMAQRNINHLTLLTNNLYLTHWQNTLIYLRLPEVMKPVSLVAGKAV